MVSQADSNNNDPLNSIDWVIAGRRLGGKGTATLAKLLSDDLKAAGCVLVVRDGEFVICEAPAESPPAPERTPPPKA